MVKVMPIWKNKWSQWWYYVIRTDMSRRQYLNRSYGIDGPQDSWTEMEHIARAWKTKEDAELVAVRYLLEQE